MKDSVRDIWLIIAAVLLMGALSAAVTWYVITTYVIPPNLNDPLTRKKLNRT